MIAGPPRGGGRRKRAPKGTEAERSSDTGGTGEKERERKRERKKEREREREREEGSHR